MDQFVSRKYIIGAIIILTGLVFLSKLLSIQVLNKTYQLSAETNTRRMEIIYPARGLMYDRNRKLLVNNRPTYDLKIAPYELQAFDTVELCDILDVDIEFIRNAIINVIKNPRERHNPIIKQVSPETFGKLKEKQYKFPGFYFSARTLRNYEKEIAAHLFGYISEVDSSVIKKDPYYEMFDYYGKSGVELTYEQVLRGKKGRKYKLIDVHGREQGSYKEGRFDTDAEAGKNIILTIDSDLQEYGEKLMKNYKGSIVAIEPATGEILTFISSPGYNPSLLIGREKDANFNMLKADTLNPLFNNTIMALYPPGSTFKPVNALIALQEGDVTYNTTYYCDLGFYARGVHVKCHSHDSPLNLPGAVKNSCNAYFCQIYKRIIEDSDYESVADAYNNWRNHLISFGFAQKLNIDLPYEKGGLIPRPSYFNRYYGEGRWKALTIISMAIGQGEVLTTPLQIANLAAIISNRGYFITPHVVKKIEGLDTINSEYTVPKYVTVDSMNFKAIVEGMEGAVNERNGTAYIARLNDIIVCGKTGTAQNPHGDDHSVFMAFAPRDNPQIAISVYVEHGVWGSRYAAPIASLMIEKYLTDTIAPNRKWIENRMLSMNLLRAE